MKKNNYSIYTSLFQSLPQKSAHHLQAQGERLTKRSSSVFTVFRNTHFLAIALLYLAIFFHCGGQTVLSQPFMVVAVIRSRGKQKVGRVIDWIVFGGVLGYSARSLIRIAEGELHRSFKGVLVPWRVGEYATKSCNILS